MDMNTRLNGGVNKIALETNGFHSGIYLLEIETEEGIIVEKIIVE